MPLNTASANERISPPPRAVPWSTKLVVVLGGLLGALGWSFFGCGMIFVWVFGDKGDYSSAFVMRGNLATAAAVVTAVGQTTFREGGSRHHQGTPIYVYHYKFNAGQIACEGTSYTTGQRARAGSEVTVEYPPGRPDRSRIQGMRRAMFSPVVGLVFLFPAFGLAFALTGVWLGLRNLRLLAMGEAARGKLIGQKATNMRVNRRTVYKMVFQFSDLQGQVRQAVVKTSKPEKLQASPFELVFYDPNDPAKTTLLDALPGQQGLTEQGDIRPCGMGAVVGAAILPLFSLATLAGGLWLKFLR